MSNQSFFKNKGARIRRLARIELTANGTIALPRNCFVHNFYFLNKTANAVTGGIRVGTAGGGTQLLTSGAVAASAAYKYPATVISLISATDQTLYIEAVTSWNSARVQVVVEYEEVPRDTFDIPGLNRGA